VQELHGIWDIGDDGKTPIQIAVPRPGDRMVVEARDELFNELPEDEGDFRLKPTRVFSRRATVFRRKLFEAYEGKCAVTRCSSKCYLKLAIPLRGLGRPVPAWAALKTDIHTLFDRGLLD
jgi:hypothetical protein